MTSTSYEGNGPGLKHKEVEALPGWLEFIGSWRRGVEVNREKKKRNQAQVTSKLLESRPRSSTFHIVIQTFLPISFSIIQKKCVEYVLKRVKTFTFVHFNTTCAWIFPRPSSPPFSTSHQFLSTKVSSSLGEWRALPAVVTHRTQWNLTGISVMHRILQWHLVWAAVLLQWKKHEQCWLHGSWRTPIAPLSC